MTRERLGVSSDAHVPVWILWHDPTAGSFLSALGGLVPLACPECAARIDLARPHGVLDAVAATPNCISASDRCAVCQTQVHFDATPVPDRENLCWPKVAIGIRPLTPPNHLTGEIADLLVQLKARIASDAAAVKGPQ